MPDKAYHNSKGIARIQERMRTMKSGVDTDMTEIWTTINEIQEDVDNHDSSIVSINTQLTAVVNFLAILGFENQPEPEAE